MEFSIEGPPPKNHGENSMWRNPVEIVRLKARRLSAARAVEGKPGFPFTTPVELTLVLWANPAAGGVDNLTGSATD